jgi:hypothetical protein
MEGYIETYNPLQQVYDYCSSMEHMRMDTELCRLVSRPDGRSRLSGVRSNCLCQQKMGSQIPAPQTCALKMTPVGF